MKQANINCPRNNLLIYFNTGVNMEKTFYIGNVKVIAVDNCTNPEERRQRLEKAIINFYKQAEREKQNDKRRTNKRDC